MSAGRKNRIVSRVLQISGLIVVLAAVLVFGLPPAINWVQAQAPIHHTKTSVLMLTLCTVRADHLGSYGYERDLSPNLDRLAADGFRFERVLAQAPWTRSSVAAIITGMFPRSLNIEDPANYENYRRLHDGFTTLAEIMQRRGYHTIGVTANPNTAAVFNMDQGYDVFDDPGAAWDDSMDNVLWDSEDVSELFLSHLMDRPPAEKFFAHLVFVDAHMPHIHKQELTSEDRFDLPPTEERRFADTYDLQISHLDQNIGRLLENLKILGHSDDLLIVVNADHGEGLREHSWQDYAHGRYVYNSTIWVPWIVHHPALNPAVASHSPMVQQIDMLPTIVELLGIDEAEAIGGLSSLAGQSRVPDMRGQQPSPALDASFVRTRLFFTDKAAVVTPEYKLIQNFDHKKKALARVINRKEGRYVYPPPFELYRYREDLLEHDELYDRERSVADDLKRLYKEWETDYPPLAPTHELRVPKSAVQPHIEALKSLGYIVDD
jgi:arylsulfatase A-like enzyme